MLKNQKGIAVALIVILIAIVLITLGFGAYSMFNAKYEPSQANQLNQSPSQNQQSEPTTKTEMQEASKEPSIKVVSSVRMSPGGSYNMTFNEYGDNFAHSVTDKTGKVVLVDFNSSNLPGYNKDWFCQCSGPLFVGWSSDKHFVVELRAQSQDGQKLLRHHMAVDASTGKVIVSTFKLISEE